MRNEIIYNNIKKFKESIKNDYQNKEYIYPTYFLLYAILRDKKHIEKCFHNKETFEFFFKKLNSHIDYLIRNFEEFQTLKSPPMHYFNIIKAFNIESVENLKQIKDLLLKA